MVTLCSYLPTSLKVGKLRFRINPSFQIVLKCFDIISDKLLTDSQKIDICVSSFLRPRWAGIILPQKCKAHLFKAYINNFVSIREPSGNSQPRVMDFKQDAEAIYSSFWQCYGIDLLGKDKDLHWWAFSCLLSGLSEDTKLMQIVSIRTKPMPKPTKYNAEERKQLAKLKAAHRIKLSEEESQKQYEEGMRKMALAMHTWAKEKR